MITVAYINTALYALSLISIGRARSTRSARQAAFVWTSVAVAVALGGLLASSEVGWWVPFPALVASTTLTAVGMSRLGNTTPRSFATMMLLAALSTSTLLVPTGSMLLFPWTASVLLVWDEVRRRSLKTARVFGFYLGLSSLLMITGLLSRNPTGLLLCLLLAVCVKEACFPFHSWFPSFVETTPMGVVVTFVTPQLGIFLHLKFLAGNLSVPLHDKVATLGVLSALFGAALASVQNPLKRVLAYLIISQSGLVTFALEQHSPLSRTGALSSWLLMGLGMAGFAMSVEALTARRGDDPLLSEPGRDFESTPALATAFMLSGLAMVGLPGTLGFVSEDLLMQGSVHEFPALCLTLIVVTALNAMTIMRALFAVFSGPRCEVAHDLDTRERLAISLPLGALFLLGLCPQIFVHWFT